ncbi:MAG: glutamate-1-semialdehyde 2,1-aminomutase [Synergistaceae bacterium]|jgi:glutamate-1-semialdehyde 2,1-aminomutase|nr:glutamate-1-semialdehyde 2,1-aminomutase [Synergistaceae bacterium]
MNAMDEKAKNIRSIAEYERRFPKSKEMFAEARKYMPAGVNSTARAVWSGWKPYPLFVERGEGSHVFDVDGNEFIDYLIGLGPMFLGHRPKTITDAVIKHISEVGTSFALASEMDTIVARKMTECVPSVERVRLSNSGTEAVTYALRLARTFTGRQKVIRFEGMYHGFSDGIYWSKHPSGAELDADENHIPEAQGPGLPAGIAESLIILDWNAPEKLERTIEKHAHEIAAVITEPIMSNTGCILPKPGYLEKMRELCTKHSIVLIFDEVITGFRVGLSGAQGKLGIKPDLSIFAKGMGGGFAVASLGGRTDIMNLADVGKVSIAGTYSGNGVALAATSATLDELRKPGMYEELYRKSEKLQKGLAALWGKSKIPAHVVGIGPLFQVWFADSPIENYRDAARLASEHVFYLWWEEMLFRGVLFHPHYYENLFVSMAHTDSDIEKTLAAAEEAVTAVEKKLL